MAKKKIDIVDVKKAVEDGELQALLVRADASEDALAYIMLVDLQTTECVRIGKVGVGWLIDRQQWTNSMNLPT